MPLIETQPDEVAQTYAASLFELTVAEGGTDHAEQVLGELHDVLELARSDTRFSEFLASQVVPAGARDASITSIFEGKASPLTVKFMRLLNRKGRLGHLPAITEALDHIVQAACGRVEVDVFTASELEGSERDRISTRVEEITGKQVVLHTYIEPSMLGGVKLKIGDQLIDDSLATQLRRVRDKLTTEGGPRIRTNAASIIDPNASPDAED
ncbi:MAG: ATP synthase F1 subunit delta [Planctomycetota bacterium]